MNMLLQRPRSARTEKGVGLARNRTCAGGAIIIPTDTFSPPERVTRPEKVLMEIVSLMKRTEPSPKRVFKPPVWKL